MVARDLHDQPFQCSHRGRCFHPVPADQCSGPDIYRVADVHHFCGPAAAQIGVISKGTRRWEVKTKVDPSAVQNTGLLIFFFKSGELLLQESFRNPSNKNINLISPEKNPRYLLILVALNVVIYKSLLPFPVALNYYPYLNYLGVIFNLRSTLVSIFLSSDGHFKHHNQ